MLLHSKLSKLQDVTTMALRVVQRRLPDFVYGGALTGIPVFAFHDVEPGEFERQLRFLADNGYRTLTMDEYTDLVVSGRAVTAERIVLLNFDDGWSSLWSAGLPLLKRYGMKAVLFLATGRVRQGGLGLTLDDVRSGRTTVAELLARDASREPFLTWDEVRALHASGLVDVQSHSVTHNQVFCSSEIEDFARPNLLRRLPVTRMPEWTPENGHQVTLGRPLYRSASRMSECRRYLEDTGLRNACEQYTADHGGEALFARRTWRRELNAVVESYRRSHADAGRFETDQEREQAIRHELEASKRMIEQALPGKQVRHFCFPWEEGSELATVLSVQAGYVTNIVVQPPDRTMGVTVGTPTLISRFGGDWLFTLPGVGRRSFLHPVAMKLWRWVELPFKDGATRSAGGRAK